LKFEHLLKKIIKLILVKVFSSEYQFTNYPHEFAFFAASSIIPDLLQWDILGLPLQLAGNNKHSCHSNK
jgi:hypothetical protein